MSALTEDMLLEARSELPNLLEVLGMVAAHLREAVNDAQAGNLRGAALVCDDLLGTFGELECLTSKVQATVAKWKQLAEEEDS